jgi:DNA-binding NtrC family response regulator
MRPQGRTKNNQQVLDQEITALFVHDRAEHLARYEEYLRLRNVEVVHARNCQEASEVLQQDCPPLLVFTDTRLSDGSFKNILELAAKAEKFINVLVASKIGNITLYMEAMECGAFDFLTPNMESSRFPSILFSAAADAMDKRSRQRPEIPTSVLANGNPDCDALIASI